MPWRSTSLRFPYRFSPYTMAFYLVQSLIEPTAGLFFWKALAFAIFLFLLYKFGWGPITEALDERESRIEDSMTRAEQALEEAKAMQAENEKKRRQAEREAQRILREAREAAEELREEELEKTRDKISRMRDQAQAEIRREKQGTLEDLRDEVADLAIEAARKVVQADLDADRHRQLVSNFIDELPKN